MKFTLGGVLLLAVAMSTSASACRMDVAIKPTITFDGGSSVPNSMPVFDKVHAEMQSYAHDAIFIVGSTTCKDDGERPVNLAEQRSESVIRELVARGADRRYLIFHYFGKQPRCETMVIAWGTGGQRDVYAQQFRETRPGGLQMVYESYDPSFPR